ncbi:MAG: DNA gyrase inhibitor YacG [Planctomycetota bacterium]|jgi:endogenous inhibitor of DNA gyrase (YacG/DUF329 family)
MSFTCPYCGKVVPSLSSTTEGKKQINAAFFPFCSEKCRLVDLGAWLDGDYVIPVSPDSPDDDTVTDWPDE